ncbi:hypothetical protein SORBI_3010G226901 [Sorghum bicolor]|uniref:Uncharacterized protein n=1 Tax=Sorghum bicolor TaxID=4558 RepID=A0A1W0VUB1_SORBI|nr:hypothetical protein SORBI_3010G226901 [Sorghum bicolor]
MANNVAYNLFVILNLKKCRKETYLKPSTSSTPAASSASALHVPSPCASSEELKVELVRATVGCLHAGVVHDIRSSILLAHAVLSVARGLDLDDVMLFGEL